MLKIQFLQSFSSKNTLTRYFELIMTYQGNRPNIPIALVATKVDLITDFTKLDQAQKLAQEKGWMFHKTSAKENIGINELFESLICKFLNLPMTIQNSSLSRISLIKHSINRLKSKITA